MKDFEIFKELRKQFSLEDIGMTHIIKEKNKPFFFAKFASEEHIEAFKKMFPITLKNRKCKVREAKFGNGTMSRSKSISFLGGVLTEKAQQHREKEVDPDFLKEMDQQKVIEMMKSRICKYHNVPYAEQITKKTDKLRAQLVQIKEETLGDDKHMVQTAEWLSSE